MSNSPRTKYGPVGYVSIAEAARRLGVGRGTVHRMVQQGQLAKHTIGLRDYVRQYDVDILLTAKTTTYATVTAFLRLWDQHPDLIEQLRAAARGGTP
jgi:excisionase family DNA binding protein